jgi:hypothetical protein
MIEMPKPPPPALTDAIKASMNEAHQNLIKAALFSESLKVYFNREEYTEFEQVNQRYEAFCEVRARDQKTLLDLDSKAHSPNDQIEYTLRLLAIVERHTEQMRELAVAFNKVIRAYKDRKERESNN